MKNFLNHYYYNIVLLQNHQGRTTATDPSQSLSSEASVITYDGVYGMSLHVVKYRNYAGSEVEGRGLKGGVALALISVCLSIDCKSYTTYGLSSRSMQFSQ